MIRKLKIRTILIALITLLIGSLATSYSIVNSDDFLKSFKITNLTNVNTKYHLEYEKTTNATVYEVIIYDESSEIIFNEKTTENVVDFDLNNLRYDEKYKLVICDNKIFESIQECADYYEIKFCTIQAWLSGRNKMPQKFVDLGLAYYD